MQGRNCRAVNGGRLFHLCFHCHGHLEMVRWLSSQVPKSSLAKPAADGSTPFAAAAFKGHLGTLAHLQSLAVDAETPNRSGDTPLHLACAEGQLEVVKYHLR